MKFLFEYIGYPKTVRFLLALILLSVFDLVGIAVIFPYLRVISEPGIILSNRYLSTIYQMAGFHSTAHFIYALSLCMALFFLAKTIISVLLSKFQFKGIAEISHSLMSMLFGALMRARYDFFLRQAPSELIGMNYAYATQVSSCFQAWLGIVNELTFFVLFLGTSFYLQPLATALVGFAMVLVAGFFYLLVVKRITLYGKEQRRIDAIRHRWSFATISSVKDAKIMGLGDMFANRTVELSAQTKELAWRNNVATSLPRLGIEYVLMTALVLSAVFLMQTGMSIEKLLPVLGLMALSALRLLPAFGRLTAYYGTYKYARNYLDGLKKFHGELQASQQHIAHVGLPFSAQLDIVDLVFKYGDKVVLDGVSLSIKKGSSIGIIGASGSGKSTMLDLITGLQEKNSGKFFLDQAEIDPYSTDALRRFIGYVPQQIALIDESIAFNIAFDHAYDPEKIKKVIKIANLEKFVSEQVHGVDTFVGEGGVRLSGGQKQRLGVARALYRDPDILIFDEATSALDNITERELSNEIQALAGNKTLIIVAHRLSTVMGCDVIYVMEHGKIAASGSHEQLMLNSPLYQAMQYSGQAAGANEAEPPFE